MRIYVASSWRNEIFDFVVQELRYHNHDVYDFKHPAPNNHGFKWEEIDPLWRSWKPYQFVAHLNDPIADLGFKYDWSGMEWAEVGLLVLPCGRSAHLEGGYFRGARKKLIILLSQYPEPPDLMYKMADKICLDMPEVINELEKYGIEKGQKWKLKI